MTSKKKLKNQKPIDYDINLKYKCPSGCGNVHWLSIQEAQTKNYKIVCDYCNTIFSPMPVKSFKISYRTKKISIPNDLLDKCYNALKDYGYNEEELLSTIKKIYAENKSINPIDIVKLTLEKMNNAESIKTN